MPEAAHLCAAADASIQRRVWGVAAVITFGAFMTGLDTSLVNVGISTIGRELGSDLAATQWVASGYLLALAAALPASGWLGRWFGAGRVWVAALAGFTVTSGLCAIAPNLDVLVGARALQGLAGGLLVSTGISILAQLVGRQGMGRVLAITGVPTVLAPAIGPTAGALLLAHFSWPWLFLINIPIGALGLVLGLRFVPAGDRENSGRLDLVGLVLVAAGVTALTYGITEAAQRQNVTQLPIAASLLGGAAALGVFTRRSLRVRSPLLDLRLFTNRVFAAATSQTLFGGAALFGGQIIMPLYFQLQRDRSVVATGLLLLPFGLGAAATFPIGGRLTDRFGGGRVAAAGLTLTTLVTVPMALLGTQADLVLVETLQVLRGVGLALSGAPVIAAAMAAVARHQLDDASAQINIVSRVGGALGSAVAVAILTSGLASDSSRGTVTSAFHTVFWWLTGASLLALVGAARLTMAQRRDAFAHTDHPPLNADRTDPKEKRA